MRFKTGDIIENLWAGENNPVRKGVYVRKRNSSQGYMIHNSKEGLLIRPVTSEERMHCDPEHYIVIGHCEIERFIREHLNEEEQ